MRKSDWKRHEQSTHLPQEEWVCMPSYPISPDEKGLAVCEFCGIRFEKKDGLINVLCILSKNSLKDFFYRTKLPISEDQLLQENPKFWQLLESSAEK